MLQGLIPNFANCIFQDMVHIADTKVARRYGDFFIRQIHKFEEVSVKYAFMFCGNVLFIIDSIIRSFIIPSE